MSESSAVPEGSEKPETKTPESESASAPAAESAPTPAAESESAPDPAAESAPQIWGRLISFNPMFPTIDLIGEGVMEIGRKDPRYKLANPAFSSTHFTIWHEKTPVSPSGWLVFIMDKSTNGTFVNGKRLHKLSRTVLKSDSDVTLLDKTKIEGAVTYRFIDFAMEKEEAKEGGPQEKYDFGPMLGQGHFAVVRKAVCKEDGNVYALKIMDKSRALVPLSHRDSVRDEAKILLRIHHPNVVAIKEIFETKRNFYMVLELFVSYNCITVISASHFFFIHIYHEQNKRRRIV